MRPGRATGRSVPHARVRRDGAVGATFGAVASYPGTLSLRDARRRYFDANGFGEDGGYAKRWVKVKVGPAAFWFPNTQGRVRAVRYHDLHHVATGYDTDLAGEAEIAAWEIASGCRGFFASWWLNLVAMCFGLFLAPGRIFRAFVRGRHTRNLYGEHLDEELLARSVSDVRSGLGLAGAVPPASPADRLAFAGWSLAALAAYALQSAALVAPVALVVMSLV